MSAMAGYEAFGQAKWITAADSVCLNDWRAKIVAAPYLRQTLTYKKEQGAVKATICGLGYYELYINGEKVGDHVLDPIVTQYDTHVRYVAYDVTSYLREGENVVGVILGNGWYNCHTPEVWHFDKASWRDYPKLLLNVANAEGSLLVSDRSWKASHGAIVFDGLRNGETYDARLELTGWQECDYDDSAWEEAVLICPPGGELEEQTCEPIKVMGRLEAAETWSVGEHKVYDFGVNISGWVRIKVTGKAGAKVTIRYGERLAEDRQVSQENIARFVDPDVFQKDEYILKGGGDEQWEPRFTYHGFQYAQIDVEGAAEIVSVEACVVYTSFEQVGRFACSDEDVNRLQECTQWAFIGNFVGIPTDCPHREKNGWTGDAQLATETGLFNYSAAGSYMQWLDTMADTQRLSGQFPGIVPTAGWGYNWGSGPAWDNAFILIPWYIYLYTGDDSAIKKHYGAMRKYVDYCSYMAEEHILSIGLGDWCHVDQERIVDTALTSTAYYYVDCVMLAQFAEMVGQAGDVQTYAALAAEVKKAFNERFYQDDGVYAKGEQTAMACAVYQGLVEETEKEKVVAKLVEAIEANGGKLDYGILGAKYVPRVLAENGHAELAYEMMVQPEFPSWVNWLRRGATTLWEAWDGGSSRNHIMFGDISAWMYQYLAGITPDAGKPGFEHVIIEPRPVKQLDWVKAEHECRYGTIKVDWQKVGGAFELHVAIPQGTTGTVRLPDGSVKDITAGEHDFKV